MELAGQIKRLRSENDLSQDDLASRIYVSRQTISNWANDKTYPDVQSLLLLSATFDVSVDSLIKGDVTAMEEIIGNKDLAKKLTILSWAGVVFLIASVVLLAGGTMFWEWGMIPSTIIWLLSFGIGCSFFWRIDRIKRDQDLVTYREIVSFIKGDPVDRDNPTSVRARKNRLRNTALRVLVCAMLGCAVGYLFAQAVMS